MNTILYITYLYNLINVWVNYVVGFGVKAMKVEDKPKDCDRICVFLRIPSESCNKLCIPYYRKFLKGLFILWILLYNSKGFRQFIH